MSELRDAAIFCGSSVAIGVSIAIFVAGRKAAMVDASNPDQVKARNKNAWIVLGALVAFVLFAFLVPVRDNPKQYAFKQTLWDMLIGNKGTQIIRR